MNADNILELQGASDEDLLMAERVQKEVLSGKITPLREKGHIAGWKKGVMGLLTFATSAIAIACSTPPRSPESTPTLPVPTIPASELTPGANLPIVGKDGQLPPKDPTPEAKGSLASRAEIFEFEYQGQKYKLVGFKNLSAGETFPSPVNNGTVTQTPANLPFSGSDVTVGNLTDPTFTRYSLRGNVKMSSETVEKDKPFASVGDNSKIKAIEGKNYEAVLWITRLDPVNKKFFTPEEILKELYPSAKQVNNSFNQETPLETTITDVFVNR